MLYREDGLGKYKLSWNWDFNHYYRKWEFFYYLTFDTPENIEQFFEMYITPNFILNENPDGKKWVIDEIKR